MAQRERRPDPAAVFDRTALRIHRDRAAPGFDGGGDFLLRAVGARLAERIDDVKRRFARVLDLGCHTGQLGPLLRARGPLDLHVEADLSHAMVRRASGPHRLVADEERLPLRPASLDLVVSALGLHWVNDLPGALIQLRRALVPDGLLLAALLGGETLFELREAFLHAESRREGGVRPHVSPFADLRDAGALLQRAGFALPVVDGERISVTYESPCALMRDLRAMGEGNAARGRGLRFARRETFRAMAARYKEAFGLPDGRVPATFHVLYLTGWRPHESQQKPARRGSARTSLAAALASESAPPPVGGSEGNARRR